MTDLTPCPVCGTPGASANTHVCMTAGVPSHVPDLGPAEVVVNDQRYVREDTLFAAMRELDAERARNRNLDAVAEAARRFERVFDSIAQDENDGTFRLMTDAALFNAAAALRAALAVLENPQ